MYFWYVQFFQKTNEKIQPNYYDTSSRIVFVRFLEELKTPKRHFEMNWPLVNLYATLHTSPNLTFLCKHLTNLVCPVKRFGNKNLKKKGKEKKRSTNTPLWLGQATNYLHVPPSISLWCQPRSERRLRAGRQCRRRRRNIAAEWRGSAHTAAGIIWPSRIF